MNFTLRLFALFFLSFLIGCGSTQNNPKIETYTKLESTTVTSLMEKKSYSMDIPENWISYLESHKHLSHAPKEMLINRKAPKTSVYIFKKKTKKKNISDLTTYFINIKKKKYNNFNYDLVKGKHPLYGRYNFVIYKSTNHNKNYTTLNALILKGENYYTITYHTLSKNYKKYADDVIAMIHTFKIK